MSGIDLYRAWQIVSLKRDPGHGAEVHSEVSDEQHALSLAHRVAESSAREFCFVVRELRPLGQGHKAQNAASDSFESHPAFHAKLICDRLLDLGITNGETLIIQSHAAWGEPIRIELNGSQFALRRNEAECIVGSPIVDECSASDRPPNL